VEEIGVDEVLIVVNAGTFPVPELIKPMDGLEFTQL
jgi:hypothetical protein